MGERFERHFDLVATVRLSGSPGPHPFRTMHPAR